MARRQRKNSGRKVREASTSQRIKDWESANYGGLMLCLGRERKLFSSVERHHVLNVKPREVDVLIKSGADFSRSGNAVARFFKKRNIIELKNPGEELSIDTLCNVYSYALQYKSTGKTVDEIKLDDLTLTVLRASRPKALFSKLETLGYTVTSSVCGIYYVSGLVDIPLQIVVGAELEGDEYIPLRVIRKNADKEDIKRFIEYRRSHKRQDEKEMADAILLVSANENSKIYRELMEEGEDMYMDKELREFFKPELDRERREGERRGERRGKQKNAKEVYNKLITRGMDKAEAFEISGYRP